MKSTNLDKKTLPALSFPIPFHRATLRLSHIASLWGPFIHFGACLLQLQVSLLSGQNVRPPILPHRFALLTCLGIQPPPSSRRRKTHTGVLSRRSQSIMSPSTTPRSSGLRGTHSCRTMFWPPESCLLSCMKPSTSGVRCPGSSST